MNLDETQKKTVAAWVAEGLKLSDIQKRISTEFGLSLTYMEARFLVDDLKLVPRDTERPKVDSTSPLAAPGKPGESPAAPGKVAPGAPGPSKPAPGPSAPATPGGVSVSVDSVTRPGTLVSGSVRFSDGQTAGWYMDQLGRLGMVPQQQGYKPNAADVEEFQKALETELSRLGL